jgi:hypothetical protein
MRSRLAAAAAFAAAVILSAPFIGQIRGALRATFPQRFALIVGGAVAVAVALAVLVALARIRERRALRYSLIAGALALGLGYIAAMSTGTAEVDAVERVHFVEYGVITLLFYLAWRPLGDGSVVVLPILAGVLVGTLEEWFQWFIPVRVGELRDVLLNLAAIVAGLLFSLGVAPPPAMPRRPGRGSLARIGMFAAAVTLVLAAFVHSVHLGYEIADAEAGMFRSRYSKAGLQQEARDRADRWRANPPIVLRRLSREDQYMDEGLWHVRRRNEAWTDGDIFASWHENLILEKYFAPVLDTPSYAAPAGSRWAPAQRVDAQNRAGAGPYTSRAEPHPIYIWPRGAFWALALAMAGVMASSALIVRSTARRPTGRYIRT